MRIGSFVSFGSAVLLATVLATPAAAQVLEAVGSRAQGMGGAFVAVANDSSATWWNPAGLADGPFMDLALARSVVEVDDVLPARRDKASWFALGTPPLGISYYRLKITDIQPFDPTGGGDADRQDRVAGVPVRSLAVSQLGATILRTLVPGIHVGTTLKYLRGTLRTGREDSLRPVSDLLDTGQDYDGGDAESAFDLDIGLLTVTGPVRLGIVGRNLREPEFGAEPFTLERQVRAGAAFDASKLPGTPLTVAVDVDLVDYATVSGERRVVAVGAEQWLKARRVGVRGGARFNMVGAEERSLTAGISIAPRAGLYLDGHVVWGGAAEERGWGVATRVSF